MVECRHNASGEPLCTALVYRVKKAIHKAACMLTCLYLLVQPMTIASRQARCIDQHLQYQVRIQCLAAFIMPSDWQVDWQALGLPRPVTCSQQRHEEKAGSWCDQK